MRYLINIHLGQAKRVYKIDARDEAQAKERLLQRLHPNKREQCIIDAINIDPSSLTTLEPCGIFGEE